MIHISTSTAIQSLVDLNLGPAFRELERRSEDSGMRINKKKAQLLVISPRNGYLTTAMLHAGGGENIHSIDGLRLVGFHFNQDPSVGAHVLEIHAKFRRRVWMLHHLRSAGLKGMTLFRLYCCYIRAVIENCSPVYHPMLNSGQAESLEKLHRQAVRICFGPTYRLRNPWNATTLSLSSPGEYGGRTASSGRSRPIRDSPPHG